MKDNKIVEAVEFKAVEETEVVEAKNGLLDKATEFGKKHGKKVIAGIALLAAGVLGYSVGKKTGEDTDTIDVDVDYTEYDEINNDYDSEVNKTEV